MYLKPKHSTPRPEDLETTSAVLEVCSQARRILDDGISESYIAATVLIMHCF